MKKITMWLTVIALGLCLGCTPEPKPALHLDLKLRRGQTVNLKIGGRGKIIHIDSDSRGLNYMLRIQTDEGPKYMWFNEFELEITP